MEFVEIDPAEIPGDTPTLIQPDQVMQAAKDRVACLERDYLLHRQADSPPELLDRIEAEHEQAAALLAVIQGADAGVGPVPPATLVSETGRDDMTEPAITVQAFRVSKGSNLPITRVVIHDEEYPVSNHSAEDVAAYFASTSATGSAHYVEDADSEQHCVRENAIAWHAPPNAGSVGIEMDGYARFTSAEWNQAGSQATLRRAATRTADLCKRHGLPIVWLSTTDLLAGRKGITGHMNVSAAFRESTHTDPGAQFPVGQFLEMVRQAAGQTTPQEVITVDAIGYRGNPAGPGGWAFGRDGGVFTVGAAQFFGSMGGRHMNAPVVGMVATPTGLGYALIGEDGGVFNFGDAHWTAYGPLTQEYAAGARKIVGADLAEGWQLASPNTWHVELTSNHLELYVL